MKIIVTHASPDWDAIGSVWILKRFLPGWQDATVEFVPAGMRSSRVRKDQEITEPIQKIGEDEIIHVDTGLGPLDHHQTPDQAICGTTRSWDFALSQVKSTGDQLTPEHEEAVSRIVNIIVAIDHFKEVFWPEAAADYHEFSLLGVLEGLKIAKPNQDMAYMEFGMECLNALLHTFENRIWAEREIADKGILFEVKAGKGIGFSTINDTVLKLSQKMGYLLVVRKDPRKGYVRIKVRPTTSPVDNLDLTLAYEKLKKIDPDATWFLHISKKMLLNGTPKNPQMKPTKLSLEQIIAVLKSIY